MYACARTALSTGLLATLLCGGLTLPQGCADTPPATLSFYDASEGCGASLNDSARPVATGASLHVRVERSTATTPPSVASVLIDDPAVFELAVLDNPFVVRALTPGTADIEVRDTDGTRGVLTLEAASPASAEITAFEPLTVWNLDSHLQVANEGVMDAFTSEGVALTTHGRLGLSVTLRDDRGRALIGHGAAAWAASPPLVAITPRDALTDDVWLEQEGHDAVVEVSSAAGGRFELTLTTAAADRLAVYCPDRDELTTALSLPAGDQVTLVLLAFDADGRLLVGNGPDGFHAAVEGDPETAAVRLTGPPWAAPEGEVTVDDEALAMLDDARVVFVRAVTPGAATLRLSAAGRSITLPVSVPPSAP